MDRNSPEFKKLKKEWDQKLKESGFEDIEFDENHLRKHDDYMFRNRLAKYGPTFFEAKQQYYRLAGQFLENHKFEDSDEKLIWQLHSDGVSGRDIVKELKKRGISPSYREHVDKVIHKFRELMLEETKVNQDVEGGFDSD